MNEFHQVIVGGVHHDVDTSVALHSGQTKIDSPFPVADRYSVILMHQEVPRTAVNEVGKGECCRPANREGEERNKNSLNKVREKIIRRVNSSSPAEIWTLDLLAKKAKKTRCKERKGGIPFRPSPLWKSRPLATGKCQTSSKKLNPALSNANIWPSSMNSMLSSVNPTPSGAVVGPSRTEQKFNRAEQLVR
ncbi:hypothetical protein U1Q18_039288 [Sarracenia purpurea var. burkii]